jgi:cytochrome b subunit of formate dehydrogenase/NAD-dependent dihydropyrimidine dehydrogenase PreA subunit
MKRRSNLPEWFEKLALNTPMLDFLLDENRSPVARMRLFSEGVNENHRILAGDEVVGDRGCMACGNCVDACPVVKDKHRFVFIQNQRSSMALENMVAEECRRCYNCIKSCPQVSKPIKEYAAGFRRAEKIIHFLTAAIILFLAFTGITLSHYQELLPAPEVTFLRNVHRILGGLLIFMPVLYMFLDRRHLMRFLNRVFAWSRTDMEWLKSLIRHMINSRANPEPFMGEFNPAQRAWYLYIILIMMPLLSLTGVLLFFGKDLLGPALFDRTVLAHMGVALVTDLLLFVHVYVKYLRKWGIFCFEMIKALVTQGHVFYPFLQDDSRLGPRHMRSPTKAE